MLPHHFQYVVITLVFKFIPDLPGIMVFSFMVNGSFYGFFCANVYYRKKLTLIWVGLFGVHFEVEMGKTIPCLKFVSIILET